MEKIETLEDLRSYLGAVTSGGITHLKAEYIGRTSLGASIELSGWKDLRVVLTAHEKNGLRLCARQDKEEGATEILVLRKTLLSEGGLTGKDWARVTVKAAVWLEKRGLYPNRHTITDITPSMFEEKT